MTRSWTTAALLTIGLLCGTVVFAEPYLAVREGLPCAQCHVNVTGSGMRSAYGNIYAQTQLPATSGNEASMWTGKVLPMLSVGANLRANARYVSTPDAPQIREFALKQARVYFSLEPWPNRLDVYLDELFAPGGASNREAFVRYRSEGGTWSVKAGQFYLPFGWRLEDNTALVRVATNINMNTPDNGVELSWDTGHFSSQFALSNGSGGGVETNTGKQFVLQSAYVAPRWRIGLAGSYNQEDTTANSGDQTMVGLFAGLRTGPVAWLAEVDAIDAKRTGADRKLLAGLVEANWLLTKGHNFKLTYETLDNDRSANNDLQTRISGVYEYTPIPFLQLRLGMRYGDGDELDPSQNQRIGFLEAHGFF